VIFSHICIQYTLIIFTSFTAFLLDIYIYISIVQKSFILIFPYIICFVQIYPLCYSFSLPHLLNNFNRFHNSVFIHVSKALLSHCPPSHSSHPHIVPILHSCHSFIRVWILHIGENMCSSTLAQKPLQSCLFYFS
jgi:hypothetical protein